MLRNFLILTIILLSSSFYCFSDCFEKPIFAIRTENKPYLRYIFLENEFDSAYVRYRLGEIRIISEANTSRLIIDSTFDEKCKIQGDSAEGEDFMLMSKV